VVKIKQYYKINQDGLIIQYKKDIVLLMVYYLSTNYNNILSSLKQESIELKSSLRDSIDNKNYDICKQLVEDKSYFESKEYTKLARKASIELGQLLGNKLPSL